MKATNKGKKEFLVHDEAWFRRTAQELCACFPEELMAHLTDFGRKELESCLAELARTVHGARWNKGTFYCGSEEVLCSDESPDSELIPNWGWNLKISRVGQSRLWIVLYFGFQPRLVQLELAHELGRALHHIRTEAVPSERLLQKVKGILVNIEQLFSGKL